MQSRMKYLFALLVVAALLTFAVTTATPQAANNAAPVAPQPPQPPEPPKAPEPPKPPEPPQPPTAPTDPAYANQPTAVGTSAQPATATTTAQTTDVACLRDPNNVGPMSCASPDAYCDPTMGICRAKADNDQECSNDIQCISGKCESEKCVATGGEDQGVDGVNSSKGETDTNGGSEKKTKAGVVVGIVFGVLCAVIVAVLGVCFIVRRRRSNYRHQRPASLHTSSRAALSSIYHDARSHSKRSSTNSQYPFVTTNSTVSSNDLPRLDDSFHRISIDGVTHSSTVERSFTYNADLSRQEMTSFNNSSWSLTPSLGALPTSPALEPGLLAKPSPITPALPSPISFHSYRASDDISLDNSLRDSCTLGDVMAKEIDKLEPKSDIKSSDSNSNTSDASSVHIVYPVCNDEQVQMKQQELVRTAQIINSSGKKHRISGCTLGAKSHIGGKRDSSTSLRSELSEFKHLARDSFCLGFDGLLDEPQEPSATARVNSVGRYRMASTYSSYSRDSAYYASLQDAPPMPSKFIGSSGSAASGGKSMFANARTPPSPGKADFADDKMHSHTREPSVYTLHAPIFKSFKEAATDLPPVPEMPLQFQDGRI